MKLARATTHCPKPVTKVLGRFDMFTHTVMRRISIYYNKQEPRRDREAMIGMSECKSQDTSLMGSAVVVLLTTGMLFPTISRKGNVSGCMHQHWEQLSLISIPKLPSSV